MPYLVCRAGEFEFSILESVQSLGNLNDREEYTAGAINVSRISHILLSIPTETGDCFFTTSFDHIAGLPVVSFSHLGETDSSNSTMVLPESSMTAIPNYVDPPERPPAVLAFSIIFIILTSISLVTRLHSRLYITHSFGPDDVFSAVGTVRSMDTHLWHRS